MPPNQTTLNLRASLRRSPADDTPSPPAASATSASSASRVTRVRTNTSCTVVPCRAITFQPTRARGSRVCASPNTKLITRCTEHAQFVHCAEKKATRTQTDRQVRPTTSKHPPNAAYATTQTTATNRPHIQASHQSFQVDAAKKTDKVARRAEHPQTESQQQLAGAHLRAPGSSPVSPSAPCSSASSPCAPGRPSRRPGAPRAARAAPRGRACTWSA